MDIFSSGFDFWDFFLVLVLTQGNIWEVSFRLFRLKSFGVLFGPKGVFLYYIIASFPPPPILIKPEYFPCSLIQVYAKKEPFVLA